MNGLFWPEKPKKVLVDILQIGHVSRDGSLSQFHVAMRDVWLEFEGLLVQVSAIHSEPKLRIRNADSISNEVLAAEDLCPVRLSLAQHILFAPDSLTEVASFRLWKSDEDKEELIGSAARLEAKNGQVLFFDPSNYFGLRIGNQFDEEEWRKSRPDIDSIVMVDL